MCRRGPSRPLQEVPAHFPCSVCGKPSYGNVCSACGGQICPDHQIGQDEWCTHCVREYPRFKKNYRPSLTVRVGYEYGYVYPPEPIREAALIATVLALKPSDVGDRTTSISSEAGTFRLATPGYGRNSWFGIPRVDSVLTDYVENVTGIA